MLSDINNNQVTAVACQTEQALGIFSIKKIKY